MNILGYIGKGLLCMALGAAGVAVVTRIPYGKTILGVGA
jgi:hypothetical protein